MNALPIERVERVFACLDDNPNRSVRDVARISGVAPRTAARYLHQWRRARIRGGDVVEGGETIAVRPSPAALGYLAAMARGRNVSRGELIAAVLEAVAELNLAEAILGGPTEPRRDMKIGTLTA